MVKRFVVLVAVLAVMLAAVAPAVFAQGQAQQEITATGVVSNLGPKGNSGTSVEGLTDEATGQSYTLEGGDFGTYEGKKVTVQGVPGPKEEVYQALNVTKIELAGDNNNGNASSSQEKKRTATLSFELKVDCKVPQGTTFLGFIPAEGGISTVLTDKDGDGTYTGRVDVPRFAPGPAPAGTEPVSLPVQIGENIGDNSGSVKAIKDFGQVKLDGDKTFKASVSLCDNSGSGSSSDSPSATAQSSYKGSSSAAANSSSSTASSSSNGSSGSSAGSDQYKNSGGGTTSSSGISTTNAGTAPSSSANSSANEQPSGVAAAVDKVKALPGTLPNTGGVLPIALIAGVLLLVSGLLIRRFTR